MKQRFLRGFGGLGGGEQVGEHVRNCGDDRQYDQGGRESSGISHRVTSSDDSRHGHSDYQQCHRQGRARSEPMLPAADCARRPCVACSQGAAPTCNSARADNQPCQRSDEGGYEQSYPGPGSIADYRDHHGDTCDRTCERSQTQFLVDPAHGSTRTQARSRGCGVSRIQGLKNSSRRCRRAIDGSPIVRLPSVRAWLGVIP